MQLKKQVFWILVLIMGLGGSGHTQPSPQHPKAICLIGQPGAPIRLDVFSDYQCPSCRNFYLRTIKPLINEYGRTNQLCLNYFDLPLKRHEFAFEASRYSVAARQLGPDPWQKVSEALYEHQSEWSENGKIEAVVTAVLNAEEMVRLKKFLKDPSINQTIEREAALANERGVSMTPTFFLTVKGREKKVNGKVSYSILKEYIERMMK